MIIFIELAKAIIRRVLPVRWKNVLKPLYIKTKFWGRKFECPICSNSFRKLVPGGLAFPVIYEKKIIGAGYNENLYCPICWSNDRDRLLFLFLVSKTKMFHAPLKLLHVAPEPSLQKVFTMSKNIEYVSVDLNSPLAQIKMDITNINMEDEIFDVIICNHVLEHIEDDASAMKELYRVLKFGGFAILQVPISHEIDKTYEDPRIVNPSDREKAFGQGDHVRIYGKDYFARLEKAGFEVTSYNLFNEMTLLEVRKYRLDPNERLFICLKNLSGGKGNNSRAPIS
jgi:predicted SAM-dependent methyltransferase